MWSPDGTVLVFGSDVGGQSGIVEPSVSVVPASGGKPSLVVKDATADW
jgi:Tol biopolymer transport system component